MRRFKSSHNSFTRSTSFAAATAMAWVLAPGPALAAQPDAEAPTASEVENPDGTATDGTATEGTAETDVDKGDRLASEGVVAFEAGEFERALELLTEAYALNPKPNLVFNIGRIHEELGQLEEASKFYTEFLTLPGVDLETRGFAAERLEVIRRVLAQAQSDAEAKDGENSDVPPPVLANTPSDTDTPTTVRKGPPKLRIAGAALAATGGAALITAAILGGISASRVSSAEDEALVEDQNELIDSAKPLAAAADGLFIGGGVVAAAGIIMVGVSYSKKFRQSATLVTPSFGPQHVSLGFSRRF